VVKKRRKVKGDSLLSISSSIPLFHHLSSSVVFTCWLTLDLIVPLSLSCFCLPPVAHAGNEGESLIGKVKPTLCLHHSLKPFTSLPPFFLLPLQQPQLDYLFMRACIFSFSPLTSEFSSGW